MALQFKAVRLPFLRVHTSKTGKTSVTWKFGPVQRNRRTGQTTIRLGRKVKWVGKTKSQKSKAKTTRTVARMNERKKFDAQFAANESTRIKAGKATGGAGAKPRTTSRNPRPGGGGVVHQTSAAEQQEMAWRRAQDEHRAAQVQAAVAAMRGAGRSEGEIAKFVSSAQLTYMRPEYRPGGDEAQGAVMLGELRAETRRIAVRGGLCGAPTRDGSSCLNKAGGCPHHEPAPRT